MYPQRKKSPNIPFPVRNFKYQTNLTWIRIYTFTKKANDFLYETNSTIISYGLKEVSYGFFWLIFYYSLIKYILSKFSMRIEFSVTFYETISFAWLLQFATHQLKTVNRFTFGAKMKFYRNSIWNSLAIMHAFGSYMLTDTHMQVELEFLINI